VAVTLRCHAIAQEVLLVRIAEVIDRQWLFKIDDGASAA